MGTICSLSRKTGKDLYSTSNNGDITAYTPEKSIPFPSPDELSKMSPLLNPLESPIPGPKILPQQCVNCNQYFYHKSEKLYCCGECEASDTLRKNLVDLHPYSYQHKLKNHFLSGKGSLKRNLSLD